MSAVVVVAALVFAAASPAASASPTPVTNPQATDRLAALARHPLACRAPDGDGTRVEVAGEVLTARTVAMLRAAQTMYGGPGDLLRVVQGSYTDDVAGSFGTHAGGGAVDISIRDPRQPSERLFGEVEAMVRALRLAGFAAWYRGPDEVFRGSVPHIHAVAIGDPELSPAAREQVAAYFAGRNGLPKAGTVPGVGGDGPDRHGGAVVCGWMGGATSVIAPASTRGGRAARRVPCE